MAEPAFTMRTPKWPVRRLRNGDWLVVSTDNTVVSRVSSTDEGWACERLGLDVDPSDGAPLVTRDSNGLVIRTADPEADEWLLSAEWDSESREVFPYYDDAVAHAKSRSEP